MATKKSKAKSSTRAPKRAGFLHIDTGSLTPEQHAKLQAVLDEQEIPTVQTGGHPMTLAAVEAALTKVIAPAKKAAKAKPGAKTAAKPAAKKAKAAPVKKAKPAKKG